MTRLTLSDAQWAKIDPYCAGKETDVGRTDKDFGALLADRAFDTDWLLLDLEERGSKAVIPPKRSRLKQRDFDKEMYKWRHLIENFFCKLKDFKKIAMRAEKTDESFAANIYLAATIIHLR